MFAGRVDRMLSEDDPELGWWDHEAAVRDGGLQQAAPDAVASGTGTYGSKSTQIGGVAARHAAHEVAERARVLAAEHLEASADDIVAKFDKLAADHVGAQLGRDIKNTVHSLEDVEVSDLTKLLREVN